MVEVRIFATDEGKTKEIQQSQNGYKSLCEKSGFFHSIRLRVNLRIALTSTCFKLVNAQLSTDNSGERSPDNSLFIDIAIENFKCDRFTRTIVDNECGAIVFGVRNASSTSSIANFLVFISYTQAFETTANSIVYTLMLLAMFPNCQEKVYEELLSEFPEMGNLNITYNNTQNLIYMDMVLNETMRVLAPVPLVARETMNDITLSNGVTLPSGVQIAIDIFNMHRRKDIWGPEADTFNPDNFLSANMQNKHSYAFIPFTKGLRYCIGKITNCY